MVLLKKAMAKCQASCPLAIDVHGDGSHAECHSYTSNHKEGIPHALVLNPVVHIEAHAKGKDILGETHHRVCFNSLTTMRVNDIGYEANDAELDSEVDHAQTGDDRDRPGLAI